MNASALAKMCGQQPYRFRLPRHDVEIGRYRGWHSSRVKDGTVSRPLARTLLRLASPSDIAARLKLSRLRISGLAAHPDYPAAAACICDPHKPLGGRSGIVYGWQIEDILQWAALTGRIDISGQPVIRSQRGRPKGSGDYASLPRCGRPKLGSVHGKGEPCRAVCRKISGVWGPACALHITDEELVLLMLPDELVEAKLAAHKAHSPYTAPDS